MVDLDPGMTTGPIAQVPDQTLDRVRIDTEVDAYARERTTTATFGDLDPVTASEILAELDELAS